ncbi:hypothetical protein LHYA1_G008275 [Lachnellula hyalina]|uniref:Thioredoxin domain-containing protein n=1 Tax=Lachnellula hyalina TaxID=1316788 RepID=A0A8H8QU28_9HELO|nr:uncharacterized protein LHYA1_G008275 [Lachnellula hyalina]TVY22817.1 hypothetical protein LHYA1_G008275 [Lachnellula hyalina]
MTFQQELNSWWFPKALTTFPVPEVGEKAPVSSKLPLPNQNGKPTVIAFLRHCGCPYILSPLFFLLTFVPVAEKTFQELRKLAGKHPEINFVAVSHSDEEATEKWVISVGGEWDVHVVVDAERELYAQWGLGVASTWHVLNPWSMYSVYQLGKKENIWNLPTESGSRWQTSGSFAVDGDGAVRWTGVAKAADSIPDFRDALKALGIEV